MRAICLLLVMLTTSPAVFGEDAEREVLAALNGWNQATIHKDPVALAKVLHKDLIYCHSDGREQTKSDQLKAVGDPGVKSLAIEFYDTTVRVYGDAAIVKTKGHVLNGDPRSAATSHLVLLYVFLRTPDGWQMVARQASKVDH
jgi:ketosteroid isomerase-like protein